MAALREVNEETNIDPKSLRRIHKDLQIFFLESEVVRLTNGEYSLNKWDINIHPFQLPVHTDPRVVSDPENKQDWSWVTLWELYSLAEKGLLPFTEASLFKFYRYLSYIDNIMNFPHFRTFPRVKGYENDYS